ncbi:MAG: putative lipase [Fibrobacter sp.]|nr:putative lipase [Fibrobacter sp.]
MFPLIVKYLLVFTMVSFSGCAYFGMVTKNITVKTSTGFKPSLGKKRLISPENCIAVYGQVQNPDSLMHNLLVVAISHRFGKVEIVDYHQLYKAGYFSLYLPSGQYPVYVFADKNNNGVFENTECAGFYTDSPMLSVNKSKERRLIGPIVLKVSGRKVYNLDMPFSLKAAELEKKVESKYYPAGTIRSLDDQIFSPEIGMLGMYEPVNFLQRAGGYLYALEELDTNKSPVIFVHGFGGTPREFKYMVEKIDRSRYEPLFFYYPSGERLQMVADIMYEIFLSQRVFDMRRRNVIICAHSMGGIVSRAAINRYVMDGKEEFLKAFISFATPYGGNESAASGLNQAPLVIPAWKDIASGSTFISSLYATRLPQEIPFYLFFAYRSPKLLKIGDNSDGTIDLKSQLYSPAQFSANAVFGFDETHTSILSCDEAISQLNQILAGI